jgi:monofunctional biosynthetic peptidoglycan transglycosylase
MADGKPRKARRVALGMILLFLVWLLGVWPPPVWWRDHWPRETAMMREAAGRRVGGKAGTVRPTGLSDVSPLLQRMVIIGEDSRFWTHHGIDPVEMADAMKIDRSRGAWAAVKTFWRRRDRMRGASTITQQLAKNLYLSSSRSLPRKVKEAVTALRLEWALPKSRILELYLGVAEWGPGIWGAQAASHTYFGVPASQLDERAAAALAATLPHPTRSNPAHRPGAMLVRRDLILARYHGADVTVPPAAEEPDSAMNEVPMIEPAMDSLIVTNPPVDSGADSTQDTVP